MKVFIFALFFSISGFAGILEMPEHCFQSFQKALNLKNETACHIRIYNNPMVLNLPDIQLQIAKNSMMTLEQGKIKLLKGTIKINTEKNISIETTYLKLKFTGTIWLEQDEEKTQLKNLNAEFALLKTINDVDQELPQGFENWYSSVDRKGNLVTGVRKNIDFQSFLLLWVNNLNPSKDQIQKESLTWKANWKSVVEDSASIYKDIVKRKLANQIEIDRAAAAKKEKERIQSQQLRDLFKYRNGLTDQSL